MAGRPTDQAQRFRERYGYSGVAALVEAEMETLGSDYRANGYTTVAQADELGRRLALRPDDMLLDVGAGCGFPGLYLAARHGCRLVSVDPLAEGAVVAAARAAEDDRSSRHVALVATGGELPLRSGTIDAVVQSDVLC